MDIDLGTDIKFNVTYGGQVYSLREPSVKEAMGFKKEAEADDMAVIKFISALGLPMEVAECMPVSKARKLVDALVGALSEKK